MRVGISTSVIQRGQTGIAQYLFALLKALQPLSAEHKFVLFVLEDDIPLFSFAASMAQIVPVPERFRPPVTNILWHQVRLPELARKERLDVLHVPSYRRLLWRKPCPLVATIHDLAPFRLPGKYDWKRMLYGRLVVRRLATRQDTIISISRNTARDIREFFGINGSTVQVVHNGIDHTRFHPGEGVRSSKLTGGLGSQRPFFLYVSRLEHPAKNHLRLICAFDSFKRRTGSDWELAFAGSDWHGADAIHAAIQRSSFARDIRCLGFVPDSQLPDLYRAAGAFVYPSLYEGFGLPPIEAMACGCPVLSSARGSLAEVVESAALIVDPQDVEDMAVGLARMAGEEPLRSRLRSAGLRRARDFDWSRTAAETLAIYERTCGFASKFTAPATHS